MRFKASTILSFITGRLYADEAPTVLFGDLTATISGFHGGASTIELPSWKDRYSGAIMKQLPTEFQEEIKNWEHSDNWRERVAAIDQKYGMIQIVSE